MRARDQARHTDESARRRPVDPPVRSDGVETMLALQRSAGNRAASTLVARAPAGDGTRGEASEGSRATLAGIGTIPLLSVSFPASRPGATGGSGGRGGEEPRERELVITSRVGEHTPLLMQAASDGRAMAVEIVIAGTSTVHLKLEGAIISAHHTSGHGQPEQTETWTLNVQKLEHRVEDGAGATSER